eukprot:SAG22_NODE_2098_length_3017_cov_1.332077_2_plen_115_part_00
MNAMVPERGDPKHGGQQCWVAGSPPIFESAAALEQWHKHLRISTARATYCKKEEALIREPDARLLNFLDNVSDADTMQLCNVDLGLEAVVSLQGVAPYCEQLKEVTINNAGARE